MRIYVPKMRTLSEERKKIEDVALAWMEKIAPGEITVIEQPPHLSDAAFNRKWRQYAFDSVCETFVLADSDMICFDRKHLERGLELIESHREFAILSAYPEPCKINKWKPRDYRPHEDDECFEHYAVGGFRFCRSLKISAPDHGVRDYDRYFCKELRDHNRRVGYLKNVRAFHLGQHATAIWEELR